MLIEIIVDANHLTTPIPSYSVMSSVYKGGTNKPKEAPT
jgi:hypothetical protein